MVGGSEEDEEEDEAPVPSPSKNGKSTAKIAIGQKGHYKGLEVTVKKVSPDGTLLTLEEDDDEEVYKGVAVSEFKPAKAEAKVVAKAAAPVDDEDLDDDDDDDD